MARKESQKVSIVTLGCSKNTVDSERLMRQLEVNNFNLIDDPNKAEAIIINTCGFIDAAKKESIEAILNAVALKKSGKVKKVLVAGCLSARYKDELAKEIPEVDLFFGTESYSEIVTSIGGKLKYELLGERYIKTPTHTAYLKISEGCDHPCSFCAIPLMRGLHKSKPMENLLLEAEYLASKGVKELIIIGQDTTDYGKDIYEKRCLGELLDNLSNVNGIDWLRVMYAYPAHFPEDVIDTIAYNPKICKYLDIPLQHISDNVLKSMRRGISSRKTKDLINKLRNTIPGLTLRTTFIVGYPAEQEKDFDELCDFVSETKFDKLGVFTYSQEESTSSFILGDPILQEEKIRRSEILMEIQREVASEINRNLMGRKLKTIIDGRENGFYKGRSYREAPEIDGDILISSENKINIGEFYDVEFYDFEDYDLFGKLIL